MIWFPLIFVPMVAWSRDLAVVALVLGAAAMLLHHDLNWHELFFTSLRTPWTYAAPAFVLWSLLAVLWAPHFPLVAWLKVFLVLTAVIVLAAGLVCLPTNAVGRLAMPTIVSVFALFGLLLFERLTDGLLIRVHRSSETTVQILNALSGGLVLLCCMCFPTSWALWRRTQQWVWSAAFVTACFALSLSYRMDAIPAGMLVGTLASLIVLRWHARAFVFVVVSVGVIALSWVSLAIGASALHIDSWLITNIDRNWGYRIIIWDYVGELLRDHFLVGYGFDAARVVGATADLMPERNGNSTFLHPHTGILQIWLELGFVGVTLFTTIAVLLFRRVLVCAPSPGAMAAAAGTFGFSATIWLLSYGIWQSWWLAVLGFAACAVILCFRVDATTNERG